MIEFKIFGRTDIEYNCVMYNKILGKKNIKLPFTSLKINCKSDISTFQFYLKKENF